MYKSCRADLVLYNHRKSPTPREEFRCILSMRDRLVDCRMEYKDRMYPGHTYQQVYITFLMDQDVSAGDAFDIIDGTTDIGFGVITQTFKSYL